MLKKKSRKDHPLVYTTQISKEARVSAIVISIVDKLYSNNQVNVLRASAAYFGYRLVKVKTEDQ